MKRFFSILILISILFTLCISVAAEETAAAFSFELPESVPITEAKTAEIASYYANNAYFTAMSEANNAVLQDQSVTVGGKTYQALVYVHGFHITDFAPEADAGAEEAAKKTVSDVEKALSSALKNTYLSLITLATDVTYRITTTQTPPANEQSEESKTTNGTTGNASSNEAQNETGTPTPQPDPTPAPATEKKDLTVYVGIATMQSTAKCNDISTQIIAPKAREWSGKSFADQLQSLNYYLLSGAYTGARKYSTVDLLQSKSGNSRDYASAAYLFLTQMGYTCEVLTGTFNGTPTAWLLVRYKSAYYHCDFYADGNFTEAGTPLDIVTTYLAVSTAEIKKTHSIDSGKFDAHVAAATASLNLNEEELNTETVDRSKLKDLLDAVTLATLQENRYTTESFKAFKDAYDAGKTVYADNGSTNADVARAYSVLNTAYQMLTRVTSVNKAALSALLNETVDSSLYVSDTYYEYQAAVTNAMKIFTDTEASQTQVDATVEALTAAKNNLVRILDKNALLHYVENLDAFMYSLTLNLDAESIDNLKKLRDEFQAIYDSDQITDAVLQDAAARYEEVIKHVEASEQIRSERAAENLQDKDTPGLASATDIRTILVLVASVFTLLAIGSVILYFHPPKFLR